MRKIRSNSKRKWIVGGVMFFASAALITTGFATWVIGTSVLENKDNIDISVDTAINDSITMEAKLHAGESFHIGETGVASGDGNIVYTKDGTATDFTILFDTVTIQCGASYFTDHFENHPFDLKLGVDSSSSVAGNVLAKNTVSNNLLDTKGATQTKWRGEESSWTYLDLEDKTVTTEYSASKWTEESGIKKCELSKVTFKFGWGTFFGGVAPTEFYNGHKAEIAKDLGKMQAVTDELLAMEAAFTASPKAVLPFILTLVPYTAPLM